MVNFNGTIVSQNDCQWSQNRAFLYGDGVFETVKIVNNKILFLEDHYFRLMASMRVLRMDIPMNFTMEFLEEEILSLASKNEVSGSSRARITVYRNLGGYYLPQDQSVSYVIDVVPVAYTLYSISQQKYEVDLYKDFYISKQLLSSIKSTNKIINITGSIYAQENGLDNCILLNDSKNVAETLHGNLFMVHGNKLITPPISEGCLNGIMRKQILQIAKKIEHLEVVEDIISPFDLQKADELFITNVIRGIQPITQYRKKTFVSNCAVQLLNEINKLVAI